jgi:hypothetical protein
MTPSNPVPAPDEVSAAYIKHFVALDASRRRFEEWRYRVMHGLQAKLASTIGEAEVAKLRKAQTEGGGTMWGYYLPSPHDLSDSAGASRGLQYSGFWMGFIAGTSYAPCGPQHDRLAGSLVFRTDLWFQTTTSDRPVLGAALAAIASHVKSDHLRVDEYGFENSKHIYVPVDRVAVLGENDQLTPLGTLVDRIAALHAAIIQASRSTDC